MKKLFLLGILFPLLFVSCSDDDEVILVPEVSLSSGEVTEHSLSFSVAPSNADVCAYMYVEEGTTVPNAESVLIKGTKIPADVKSDVKLEELKDDVTYNIVAAVGNSKYKVLSDILKLRTIKEIIPQITISAGNSTETTLSFTANPIDATSGAFVCLKASEQIPSVEEIIANGTPFAVDSKSEIVIKDLEAGTSYMIAAAVANKKNYVLSEVLEMKTAEAKVIFTSAEGEMYSEYADVIFKDETGKYELQLDFNTDFATVGYMPAGTYKVGSANDFYIDNEVETTVLKSLKDGKNYNLTSGSVNVTITDKKEYHIEIDVVLDNGSTFKAEYEGLIKNIDVVFQLKVAEAQLRPINNSIPGEYYIYMHDNDWNWELYVDFFADPKSTALTAGTYKFSKEKTPGTFGPQSNIQIYTPYSNNYLTGGKIEVKLDGDTYTITMSLVGESGREMEGTFTGKIKK